MPNNYKVEVIGKINPDNKKVVMSINDKEFALVIIGKDKKDTIKKFRLAINGMLIVKSFMSILNILKDNKYNKKIFNKIAHDSKKKRETLENATV